MFFRHGDLWERITKLSKVTSRRYAVVAYLGSGASKLLTLGDGDVLVVDMSDRSVKSGHTSPAEILTYLDNDVQVFSVENLHAKVFVFDDVVIAGSSNVSRHSRDNLVEAAIETKNRKLRDEVLAWIDDLPLDPVTPKLARAKLKIYKPPKWGGGGGGRKRRAKARAVGRQLWLLTTQEYYFDEEENAKLDEQAKQAKHLSKGSQYVIDPVRCNAKERFSRLSKVGDSVICLHHEGRGVKAWPPARIVAKNRYWAGGAKRMGIQLEYRNTDRGRSWKNFKKAAKAIGLNVSKRCCRRIASKAADDALLRYFGRSA